jgi:group I intron endonuclease
LRIGDRFPLTGVSTATPKGKWVVYLLTCSKSSKGYVGITKNLRSRMAGHVKDSSRRGYIISRAVSKYGVESFTVEVLSIEDSFMEAGSVEQALILDLGTLTPGGYNIALGGEGVTLTGDQEKQRMAAVKRSYIRPEVIEKMKARDRIKWGNPDFRKTHKDALRKANSNPSYAENRRAARIASGLVSPVIREDTGEIFETVRDAAKSIDRTNALVIYTCKLGADDRNRRAQKGLPNFRYL